MFASRQITAFLLTNVILFAFGCSDSTQPNTDATSSADNTPEAVYRQLFLAIIDPDERAIRDLIVDNDDADVLWSGGSYPDEVAALLATQYREMTIERVESPSSDRVVLRSSAAPLLLTVVKQDNDWRVDAEPLIQMRRAAVEVSEQHEGQ